MNVRLRQIERRRAIDARLGREYEIWLSTVRHDGRPHMAPVFFVWLDDILYFATGADTVKWINLIGNQSVALALPDPNNVVIIEGVAHACDRRTTEVLADYFYNKYEWSFLRDPAIDYRLVRVEPRRMMAWGDGYDDLGIRVF